VNGSLGRAIKIIPNSYRFQRFQADRRRCYFARVGDKLRLVKVRPRWKYIGVVIYIILKYASGVYS